MQTLTLVSGGCADAFDPQLEALRNIYALVQKVLAREIINGACETGKIELKRRVFAKVRPGEDRDMGFTVPFAEDPLRRAGKIDHMWSIRHRIEAGSQDASGRIRRVNPVIIRPGDFVDIAVTLQTVSLRLPRGKRGVEVMLIPQAIVKLVSSEDAMMLMKTVAEENEFLRMASDTTTARRDTGFVFEGDEDMND
ncbi:hypothetical protein TRAPUB_8937 [Trametes pubescens]|uniref:Uncharacterized protein n=1 Tax=Trametes pubescens TaxID=154538 RepID=A0A1M2W3R5_TRAPU|nr:hypothetical protein TRAPUB_3509 [Trametes pubescens]OJT13908.1 hypothetical protein TRAPUB_9577 [Trametes pubescens]OJT14491.1 hypothetical protein TRAPUB_8937 [Trametes pubescens]